MTRFDFSPLFRSTIGFDRTMRLLETAGQLDEPGRAGPPYDILATGEDSYRIALAVAGYTRDELTVEVSENTVTVSGRPHASPKQENVLFKGISNGGFERRFQLADYVEVSSANLENGMLYIDLKRELPEKMKPRHISIGSSEGRTIEGMATKLEAKKGSAAA